MSAEAATVEFSRMEVADLRPPERSVPLMSTVPLDPRIREIADRCNTFLALPANWNSYRSRRIEKTLIEDGLRILTMLLRPGSRTPDVVPTAFGGIQIEWHADEEDEDLEIEVHALGHYRVFHRRGDDETEFEVFDDISKMVRLVRAFPT